MDSNVAELLDRNQAFAASTRRRAARHYRFSRTGGCTPQCLYCCVDPAEFLGLSFGEALVERNIGGRLTPHVIQDIAYASYLVESKAPTARTSKWRSSTTPIAAAGCSRTTSCATDSRGAPATLPRRWPTFPPPIRRRRCASMSSACVPRRRFRGGSRSQATSTTSTRGSCAPSSSRPRQLRPRRGQPTGSARHSEWSHHAAPRPPARDHRQRQLSCRWRHRHRTQG